jgi:hypothetical protein
MTNSIDKIVHLWNTEAPAQANSKAIINLENVHQLSIALNGESHPAIANLDVDPYELVERGCTNAELARIDRATTLAYADTLNTTLEEAQAILKGTPMSPINDATPSKLVELARKQERNEAKLADIALRLQAYRKLNTAHEKEIELLTQKITGTDTPASDPNLQQVMRDIESKRLFITSNNKSYDKLLLTYQTLNNRVVATRDRIHAEQCALAIKTVNEANKEIEAYFQDAVDDDDTLEVTTLPDALDEITKEAEDDEHIFNGLLLEQKIRELREQARNKEA